MMHPALVERLVTATRRLAAQANVAWQGHLATNGLLSPSLAHRVARWFDTIGLSCDGPAAIQDQQRPRRDGRPTSHAVATTARIFAEMGVRFSLRTTITPASIERQAEIAEFLCETFAADTIYFEPAYRLPNQGDPYFTPVDAPRFAEYFLAAEDVAHACGKRLIFAGVRLDELHGPYCDVLRDSLHLTPDGRAVSCFFTIDGRHADSLPKVIGHFDTNTGTFILDERHIAEHRRQAAALPATCRACLCAYHCARGCPEQCALMDHPVRELSFRCLLHRHLAEAWIRQATAHPVQLADVTTLPHDDLPAKVASFLAEMPSPSDQESIRQQWEAVRDHPALIERTMPRPLWAQRGFTESGGEAWQRLTNRLDGLAHTPLSCYLHVPFCDRRCAFCDCYAQPLGRARQGEAAYVQRLVTDITAWSRLPGIPARPVTTVHFGGGTPTALRPEYLAEIVGACCHHLNITPATEWALESTSSLLTASMLDTLCHLGFTRLHLGVQTLEDTVRRRIGRRDDSDTLLARIGEASAHGMIVSVDLIYGLPGQTPRGWLETITRLDAAGVQGMSLYQLQTSSRNRAALARLGAPARDTLTDYLFFQMAAHRLFSRGYSLNHFTHFARVADRNLYYTYPLRGEDLLALGPTADGIFGAYQYRHHALPTYLGDGGMPAMEGGTEQTPREQALYPAQAALMGGAISGEMLDALHATILLRKWLRAMLLTESPAPGHYTLTPNGCWCIESMLHELAGN